MTLNKVKNSLKSLFPFAFYRKRAFRSTLFVLALALEVIRRRQWPLAIDDAI